MKSLAPSLLLYLGLLLDDLAGAFRIPVVGRQEQWGWPGAGAGVARRAGMTSDLVNSGDVRYYTNVSLGGDMFQVLIDTGSSDLWVAGNVHNAKSLGKSASVNYAIGEASGTVMTAELQFEGYTISDQAFISVAVDSAHPTGQGTIGLGPNSGSEVHSTVDSGAGDAVLDRIFRQNTSTPNYLTILLGRDDDTANPFAGDITVGSLVSGFENITSQPKLQVQGDLDSANQHWQTLLDKDGILGPDGQVIQTPSSVRGGSQLTVVFDSGFSLPQVPRAVSDAIYGRVPGANFTSYTQTGQVWTVPCNVELNVTFKFGGISFPVNPVDTSSDAFYVKDANGDSVCIGTFQPITSAASSDFDMILGMAFLRNAYLLVDFGDFVDGSSSKVGEPYIQLLSTTNPATAHTNFVSQRLNGIDNTSSFHLGPAMPNMYNDDDATVSNSESLSEKIKPYLPYIIAGSAAVGVLLIIAVWYCISNSRRNAYRRLQDPAPIGIHHELPPSRYQQPHRRY
ncbi:acid protease [Amylocystis lapponica]|nr:acid protease [Amylocystis lapponica]